MLTDVTSLNHVLNVTVDVHPVHARPGAQASFLHSLVRLVEFREYLRSSSEWDDDTVTLHDDAIVDRQLIAECAVARLPAVHSTGPLLVYINLKCTL